MLVNINLLPQKEKKSKTGILILSVIGLIIVIGGALFYFSVDAKNQELSRLETQIAQTNEIIEAQRDKLTTYHASDSVNQLENAIHWAEGTPYRVEYLLQELTALLPQRGFITEFEMSKENRISMTLQFDTKSEGAYYLHSILTLAWVNEAVLTEGKIQESQNHDLENEGENEDVLPRYIAQYEIDVNIPLLKQSYEGELEQTSEEEGGNDE